MSLIYVCVWTMQHKNWAMMKKKALVGRHSIRSCIPLVEYDLLSFWAYASEYNKHDDGVKLKFCTLSVCSNSICLMLKAFFTGTD